MLKKYYYGKEKFYLFTFEDGFTPDDRYNKLQITVNYSSEEYCIWGIKGTNAELLEEGFTNHFDFSLLEYADTVEEDEN